MRERTANHVLAAQAQADRDAFSKLLDELQPHPLQRGEILGTPAGPTEFVHFVESGIVSLLATTQAGSSVEVALIGGEGVAGIAGALGTRPLPYRLMVQVPGLAYRVPRAVIREHIFSCSALHNC
jgi:CRP-like cAMP-binding protein